MDTINKIGEVCSTLLPIFGVLALIALIIFLVYLVKLFKGLNETVTKANTAVDGVNEALDTVNGYIKDLNVTVNTVNNVAMSVEAVRATAERAVKKSAASMSKQYEQVKTWVTEFLNKATSTKKTEPVDVIVPTTEDVEEAVVENVTEHE